MDLFTPLQSLSKITPKYAQILGKLGLHTVQDLLLYFPFRYDDFSTIAPISEEYLNETITVEGRVVKAKLNRIFRRRMTVVEVVVEDENGTPLKAVWFNQPFVFDALPENTLVRLSGKLTRDEKKFVMSSPNWERAGREATNTGRLVPIYSETTGLTSKWLRWQIKPLLPAARDLPDILSYDLRKKYNLYDHYTAITQIHFPDSQETLIRAQKRFAFQEMLLIQLKALQVRRNWEGKNSQAINFNEKLIKDFVSRLPFKLTNAQRKSAFEILKDLEKPTPMNRLLNGDVGAGKTMVAAIAALQTIDAGYQVAIMAPTEVLARQHFMTLSDIFESYEMTIALLTNSYQEVNNFQAIPDVKIAKNKKNRRGDLLKKIEVGQINLIIGTHALIQKDVRFNNLALVVIDEQHRFGVAQRANLQQTTMEIQDGQERTIPHLLTMTATPIPRTLAIAFFGSLDVSLLDEMPKNRKPIKTSIVTVKNKSQIYAFIKNEIRSGRQAFIIFPLVEESEALTDIKAAVAEHERLSNEVFSDFRLGLLHGRLKAKEKEQVMTDFKEKKTDILVSTSVVEVGVDVPNATVMIIENSDRFGLSQLHQFRGRVGRGQHQSYCFLFTDSNTKKAIKRLEVLAKTNDGFQIAEQDLALRGPGQFFGSLQSGIPDITMENLGNVRLIKFTRLEAQSILNGDPELKKHPLLADALQKFSEKVHLE